MSLTPGALVYYGPRLHRFTVADVERMTASGVLGPQERVELIEGDLLQMSPVNSQHSTLELTVN